MSLIFDKIVDCLPEKSMLEVNEMIKYIYNPTSTATTTTRTTLDQTGYFLSLFDMYIIGIEKKPAKTSDISERKNKNSRQRK